MIQKHVLLLSALAACGWLTAFPTAQAAADQMLWQVGHPDQNNAEFALAPRDYANLKQDGFFVVGESDPKRDWPYVQPGPQDAWAGAKPHTFTILFGLKTLPAAGDCQLAINLLDTQKQGPPKLRLTINGQSFERDLPPGAGDESINGQPAKGKPCRVNFPFPASLLRTGDNEVRITTLSGSWMLYDSIGLATPAGAALTPVHARTLVDDVQPIRALIDKDGSSLQPVVATFRHYGEDTDAAVRIQDGPALALRLTRGVQSVNLVTPAVSTPTQRAVIAEIMENGGKTVITREVTLKPVRKLTVYILPHSHTDIGYTAIQTDIEKKQVNNLIEGIAYARQTSGYPAGARFVWNVEVLWAADLYLHRLNDQQRADFLDAVKNGQVCLNGMYLNELTGLCRPEELVRLFRFATQLAARTGASIDSAMISDVPGYTWGTVTAMAQAGIKYFSTAPNYFDRIGTILREWENKPFYWTGPDERTKVLVWIPFWGYAMSHVYGQMSPQLVNDFSDGLDKRGYPYDIAHVRWSGHGDNAVPDPAICEFVKDWNVKYSWPKFIISGTSDAFRAFEQRYGNQLPRVRGDWTPYWEDGAGSSALETGLNRQSSDRLAQAETVFALRAPRTYPAARFEEAWNNVLLYSEHTWGAWCSISGPERPETREQWDIKKSYADQADRESCDLLATALGPAPAGNLNGKVDVINALSWQRTELVLLPRELSAAGDRVSDEHGRPMPSQRLASGQLVFLAKNVPPLAAKRFVVSAGSPHVKARATAQGAVLDSGAVRVRVDETTGGIVELTASGIPGNLADTKEGEALNDYRYLIGDDLKNLQRNGPVKISIGEKGPLVASLVIESDAPGCRNLRRELRVVAGQDYVELLNLVDKQRLAVRSYMDKSGKESVNFAFPFNVPDGEVLLDLPLGVMRPDADQMPSACKNWFTVGRWADVSNRRRGVTWVTLDAPLVEVGGITATLLNSQTNPDIWRKKVGKTQKLYSWAMNNHWGTNYRAYQEGPVWFRFILRPHRQYDPAEATRFATAFSQPLLAGAASATSSVLTVNTTGVVVMSMKPSDDGQAVIVRLYGASGKDEKAVLKWGSLQPTSVHLSDTSEKPGLAVSGPVSVPGFGVVTLRAELGK